MSSLRAVFAEVFGLFVDDGALAVALVGWCAALGIGVWIVPALVPIAGPVLLVGCALILVGNVVRTVRR